MESKVCRRLYVVLATILLMLRVTTDAIGPIPIVTCDDSCNPSGSPGTLSENDKKRAYFFNKTFLIIDGHIKQMLPPFLDTIQAIKQNGYEEKRDLMRLPYQVLAGFLPGRDIPSGVLKRKSFSADDSVALELKIVHTLQEVEPKLLSKRIICYGCKNPSVIFWQDHYLMTYESHSQKRFLQYFWLNTTNSPLSAPIEEFAPYGYIAKDSERENWLGISTFQPGGWGGFSSANSEGADARVTVLDENTVYVACEHPMYFMALTVLSAKPLEDGKVSSREEKSERRREKEREKETRRNLRERESELTIDRKLISLHSKEQRHRPHSRSLSLLASNESVVNGPHQIWPDMDANQPQKNWSPFIYNGTLHLLQTVYPLHVVTLTPSVDNKGQYHAKTVSYLAQRTVRWAYGDVRGGTNCVPIGLSGTYLAFFHARYTIPYNGLVTYVFGAYTFAAPSAGLSQFRLTGMSTFPIYIDPFHQGGWFNRRFDYVVYPTGLFVNESDDAVYLTVGYNDHTGYLLKFSLLTVLESLAPILD